MIALVLAMMLALAPGRDHSELAGAIARVAESERPLFANDESRAKTAALLVAVSFRESTFKVDALGDHGRSFCAFQIHQSSGGSAALLTDTDACVRKGLAMLRESLRVCPSHPVAWYARAGAAHLGRPHEARGVGRKEGAAVRVGDTITILPGVPEMPLDGKRGRIVSLHVGWAMATVDDDARPHRRDHGTFIVHEPVQHHGGAE